MLRIIAIFEDLIGCIIHEFAPDGKCTQIIVMEAGKKDRVFDPIPERERETAEQVRGRVVKHGGKITFDNLPKA